MTWAGLLKGSPSGNGHATKTFPSCRSRSRTIPHAVLRNVAGATMMSITMPIALARMQLCTLCQPSLSHEDEVGRVESLALSGGLAATASFRNTHFVLLSRRQSSAGRTRATRETCRSYTAALQCCTGPEREGSTQSAAPRCRRSFEQLRGPQSTALCSPSNNAPLTYPLASVCAQGGRILAGYASVDGQAP